MGNLSQYFSSRPGLGAISVMVFFFSLGWLTRPNDLPYVRVAFIGNSMMYYNDLPRFLETLSNGHIAYQNSCLHGNGSFRSLLVSGNGMMEMWTTGSARISHQYKKIYDYGACTIKQLLTGYDDDLDQRVKAIFGQNDDDSGNEDQIDDDDDYNNINMDNQKQLGDDFFSYDDGLNPCLHDPYYYKYLQTRTDVNSPFFHYVVMNDNTRSAARFSTRQESLQYLHQYYVPLFREQSHAIPVLLCTYAYDTPYRDMTGLGSVAEFTSLTYEGYREYAQLLSRQLPATQQARIAPVSLAFLMVYEENIELWKRLFHVDYVHTSPLGSFLQGCVVYQTLFGVLPSPSIAIRSDMSYLWVTARRLQPPNHRRLPFPTPDEAAYLYHVAKRVTMWGEKPKTFIPYHKGEAIEYEPNDDAYRIDDLF